jgi:hypothetical protein
MKQLDLDWVREQAEQVFSPETVFEVNHIEAKDPTLSQAEIVVLAHGTEVSITLSKNDKDQWMARVGPIDKMVSSRHLSMASGIEPAQFALEFILDWMEAGWRDFSKTKPVAAAYYERRHHQILADRVWEDVARKLIALIPEELNSFADEKEWLESERYWKLPEFLQKAFEETLEGRYGFLSIGISSICLADAGLSCTVSTREVIRLFEKLNKAWEGRVEVSTRVVDGRRFESVQVYFHVVDARLMYEEQR